MCCGVSSPFSPAEYPILRSKNRRSWGSHSPTRTPLPGYDQLPATRPSLTLSERQISEPILKDEDVERVRRQLDPRFLSSQAGLQKQDEISAQGGHHARFYDKYRDVAKEFDEEFLKKHGGDLDTTLIFVSSLPGFD